MTRPFSVASACAVIVGGGSGIGRATAHAFARRGANLVIGDLREERAKAVAEELRRLGAHAVGLGVDAASEADLQRLRDAALEQAGGVDLVMNNVGVLAMGAPETLPDEAWQRALDTNVMSIARSNRVFLPVLLEQGSGHVVNTASASGLLAYGFDRLPYVASKHAVVGITEALAIYLGPRGIGVTCLCPSGVITNILDDLRVYGQTGATPRGPQHSLSDPADVGEAVAAAVAEGRFLVTTAPEIGSELDARAADIEAFLQARIAEQDPQQTEQPA